jgi:ribosomal protein S18 acetylase RimI-like enzyme
LADNTSERRIEILDAKRHVRDTFSCGIASLDEYFRSRARQDTDKYAAAVFVMAECATVTGYYTLTAYAINAGDLPDAIVRKLPRYPNLPATLIGRLAVDRQYQRKGIGEELLVDALKRSLENTSRIGSVAVVVEAGNEHAKKFYQAYGFIQFPGSPNKLSVPMRTIRDTLKK